MHMPLQLSRPKKPQFKVLWPLQLHPTTWLTLCPEGVSLLSEARSFARELSPGELPVFTLLALTFTFAQPSHFLSNSPPSPLCLCLPLPHLCFLPPPSLPSPLPPPPLCLNTSDSLLFSPVSPPRPRQAPSYLNHPLFFVLSLYN